MTTTRLVAAAATFLMLSLLFAVPSPRAEEAGKIQDRLNAEAIVLDPRLSAPRLNSAARRLPRRTITFETRVGPNLSVITRFPETFAERQ